MRNKQGQELELRSVDEHTFCPSLLTGKLVVDAGCRNFHFSYALADLGCPVLAMDIEDFNHHADGKVWFRHGALWDKTEPLEVHRFGNGTANFVKGLNGIPYNGPDRPCVTETVQAYTLEHLLAMTSSKIIDLLKLDVEASEYRILLNIKADLLPRQITVETHRHVNKVLHDEQWPLVLNHLDQWYSVSRHSNYPDYPDMDTLFIRRDLL